MHRFFCLLFALASGAALAQPASVAGTVRDASGFPLPGANVYLSGTTHGDATDADGKYEIEGVAPGAYRVVGSMLGFETLVRDVRLAGGDRISVTLELSPSSLELGAASVEVDRDRRWERRMRRFREVLIGESANADSTEILNPEVLEFGGSWGTLTAAAAEPLVIINRALGYRLRYDLTSFEANSGRIRYDGDEVFEPLAPESPQEAARWEAARRRAFLGSQAHFMRSLLAGTAEDEGFTLIGVSEEPRGAMSGGDVRTASDRVMGDASYGWGVLRFTGRIEVTYGGEPEEPAYLDSEWFRERRSTTEPVQRSALHLNEVIVKVDPQGSPEDPFAITTSGYMAFERLADRVPKDYAPPVLESETP